MEWICVKDRLPQETVKVLVCWKNTGGWVVCEGYYMGADGWRYVGWEAPHFVVTHWMYLPEPPKERPVERSGTCD